MVKKTKLTQCSLDEEMLMFTSYRYCIGRKTYVNSLAPYIGKKYYPLLSAERAEFTAQDIRRCIGDCLQFHHPSFTYDGTVSAKEQNPLSDYIVWLNNNVSDNSDLQGIKEIVCYKDSYKVAEPKKYDVVRCERKTLEVFEHEMSDLLEWDTLASLFDRKNHKLVTTEYNGETRVIRCFEAWTKASVPTGEKQGNLMWYKPIPWKYVKVFMSVSAYLECGRHTGYLREECIIDVKDVDVKYDTKGSMGNRK